MATSIAIIGAGISGLSAGCYARMNGYDAQIFELHDKPGGLCTSWQHDGYTFDGCLEWLLGTHPESGFHRMWRELGALPGRQVVHHSELTRYEGNNGEKLVLHRDPDALREHLKDLSPVDGERIDGLHRAVSHFRRVHLTMERPHSLKDVTDLLGKLIEMAPAAADLLRYRKTSVADWAAEFRDPFLREAWSAQFALPDFPFLAMVATLAFQANGDAGYPIGGSLSFSQAIAQRFESLGGVIHYGRRVTRILVEGDRTVGLAFENGEAVRADLVVSAADGHSTVFDLLGGAYLDHALRERFGTLPSFPSLVRVSLGVAMDLGKEPHDVNLPLKLPISIDGELRHRLVMRHYSYDPSMAPPGKSVVVVSFPASYEAWRALHEHLDHYRAEKVRIADDVIRTLDQRLRGFGDSVEAVDVATPLTFARYTANWNGSIEGWLLTTRTLGMRMADTLPGLSGFHMIGQWVLPGGGVPAAAWSGRNLIRKLCEQHGTRFMSSGAASLPNSVRPPIDKSAHAPI